MNTKHITLIMAIVLLWPVVAFSQTTPSLAWANGLMETAGPQGSSVQAQAIATDASGNSYVVGYFHYTADFDPGTGTADLSSSGGSPDAFVAKYDASGNYVFAFKLGAGGDDKAYDVAIDGSGNFYVTGRFQAMVDFDPGAGTANLTQIGSFNVFVAKYDASGNYINAFNIGGSGYSEAYGIAIDASNNVLITGMMGSTQDFDPSAGTANVSSHGGQDGFLAKYDASGNYVYAFSIGGSSTDQSLDVAVDGSGNAYITGYFYNSVDFDPGAGSANLSAIRTDIFLAKYNASGNYVYAHKFGTTSDDRGYGSLTVDASGNAYITGQFIGTIDFDPSGSTANLTSVSGYDIYLAKYNSSGSFVFAKRISGSGTNRSYDLTLDGSNNILLTGYIGGTTDFDPGAGTANLTSSGYNEVFLAKYNSSGNYIYAILMGSTGSDGGHGVAVDGSGNAYVAGIVYSSGDFDPGAGTANIGTGDFQDGFVASYDGSGNYNYAIGIGGYNNQGGSHNIEDIAVDDDGNVYITGYFQNTVDFDAGPDTTSLTSNGDYDIFLAKYDAHGNIVYAVNMGSTSTDVAYGVVVDGSGNTYITGYFSATADFDPGAGTASLTSNGGQDGFLAKYDASGNYVFAISMGGSSSDISNELAVDASGNVYITGQYIDVVDFDPGPGTANLTSTLSYQSDIFLAKYDASGNYVYAISMGGTGNDYGYGVAVDASNNAYITGGFRSTVDFDPGAGTANLSSLGQTDIFLAKYNASGNYVYAYSFGGNSSTYYDYGYAVAIDGSNNVCITGVFHGTIDFNPGAGTNNLSSNGGRDVFFARYSPSGSYLFAHSFGSTSQDYGFDIATDADDNVYVAGYFTNSATDLDPGAGTTTLSTNGGGDIFLAKYDASNNLVYGFNVGNSNTDRSYAVAADSDGDAFIGGYFQGTVDFDPGTGTSNLVPTGGGSKAFLAKYTTGNDWTGANGTDWNDTGNWVAGTVPTTGVDVVIPGGLTNYPALEVNPTVGDIEVETGATVTIPANQSLTVQGVLTNDGTITVESGGSLIQETGSTLAGSGTYSVQQDKGSGVSFISSPIANIAVNGFGISPTGNNGGQIIPSTSNPCNPDSIDISSDYGNLLELRENPSVISNCAQSLWFVKSTGNLTDGRGYSLNSGATTLNFTGTINNGTVTYSGLTRQSGSIDQQDGSTSTRGWHLVGNPYPSPITLVGSDLTGMGFDAQIQRYDDATGSWFSNDPLVTATVAVGQGFQIRKTSVGGSADFELDNDFRTAGNPGFFRQQAPREYYLTMTLDNGSMSDESMIYFYDGATDGFDALYDANRLMGKITNPHLYTVADDERLSYNAYALMQPEETKTVPVGVHSGVYGQFTLTFNDLNTLDAVVTLEDTKLGTFTELSEGYTYTFTTVEGDANERFLLHFAQNKEEQPVGIDIITQEDIKLYPNPTSDNLTIELPKEHAFTDAVILNVAGQQVMNLDGVDDKTTLLLNTTKLSEGIYYIKLQGAYSTTLRFIKL